MSLRRILGFDTPTTPPVRPDQVMRLLNVQLAERDASDALDPDNPTKSTPDFDNATAAYWAEVRRSTQAELHAADEALRRADDWASQVDQSGEGWAR
jgi:hypothetical protein